MHVSYRSRLAHCRTRRLCRGEKKGQQRAARGSLGLEEGSWRSRGCLASTGVWCIAYPLPTSVFLRVNEAQTAAVEALSPIHLSLVTWKPLSVSLLGAQSSVIGDLRTKASSVPPLRRPRAFGASICKLGRRKGHQKTPPHPRAQPGNSHIISAHLP